MPMPGQFGLSAMNAAKRLNFASASGVSQDEPFDKLAARRVADGLLDDGRFTGLGLARQIDRLLDRRKIAGERRSLRFRRCCLGTLRLAPLRRRMRRMPCFLCAAVCLLASCVFLTWCACL